MHWYPKEDPLSKNAQGIRYATSCVVESSTITGAPLPTLELHQAVVLQDTINMTFRHPHSGKKCTIRRTQLPILPTFAMTAHKAQGQTMKKVLVDFKLESCKGTESPYVMVSQVASLEGLLILRPLNPQEYNLERKSRRGQHVFSRSHQ